MNLIEAVSSGRPFRRPKWVGGYLPMEEVENFVFSVEDLLATDWEVQEKQVTITLSKFTKAWNIAHNTTQFIDEDRREFAILERLQKELGL